MYKRILIALDGTELSTKALDAGIDLARALNSSVIFVLVTPPLSSFIPGEIAIGISINDYDNSQAKWAEQKLETAKARAIDSGLKFSSHHIANAYPSEAIVQKAAEAEADLIIVAPHQRNAASWFFFGSESSRVVAETNRSVLIVR